MKHRRVFSADKLGILVVEGTHLKQDCTVLILQTTEEGYKIEKCKSPNVISSSQRFLIEGVMNKVTISQYERENYCCKRIKKNITELLYKYYLPKPLDFNHSKSGKIHIQAGDC